VESRTATFFCLFHFENWQFSTGYVAPLCCVIISHQLGMEGRGVEEGAGGGESDGEARDWFDVPGVFESLKRVVANGQDGGDARDVDAEELVASAAETPAREGTWERGRLNFGSFSAAMRSSMFQALDQLPGIAALSKSPMVSALAPYTPLAVKSWIAEHEAPALLGLAIWFALIAVLLTHLVTRAIAKVAPVRTLLNSPCLLFPAPRIHHHLLIILQKMVVGAKHDACIEPSILDTRAFLRSWSLFPRYASSHTSTNTEIFTNSLSVDWIKILLCDVQARRKKLLPTIMGMLESDPDLHIFLGYWQAIGDVGPWDRPDLDKPPALTTRPQEGVAQEHMILFAPTNDAFQVWEGNHPSRPSARSPVYPFLQSVNHQSTPPCFCKLCPLEPWMSAF
jgi:hypothetical protein